MSQKIIFTTLPHRISGEGTDEKLELSVLVTLQLNPSGNDTLSSFPDISNWINTLQSTPFGFRFSDGTTVPARLKRELLDETIYNALFYPEIKVKPYAPDNLLNKRLHSYPIQHIHNFVMETMRTFAVESPARLVSPFLILDKDKLGSISRVELNEGTLREISKIRLDAPMIRQKAAPQKEPDLSRMVTKKGADEDQIRQRLFNNRFIPFETQARPNMNFTQFRDFHQMSKSARVKPFPTPPKPEFEYHDMLSILMAYPSIQRKLGLVLDFQIPHEQTIPSVGEIHLDASALNFTDDDTIISTPLTAYKINGQGFFAASNNDSIIQDGFLKLNTPSFTVYQGDMDGAAYKMTQLAEVKTKEIAEFHSMRIQKFYRFNHAARLMPLPEEPKDEGLPTIRSAGIAVARNGMSEHLHQRLQVSFDMQKVLLDKNAFQPMLKSIVAKEKVFYADDLTQGYRMDIAYDEQPGKWFSLHQRRQTYEWYDKENNPHPIADTETDEGFLELSVMEDAEETDELFVHETFARWEGWSLSVDRPGMAINEPDEDSQEPVRRDFIHKDKSLEMKKYLFNPELKLRIHALPQIVPGTLPRLRFGKSYAIRIRTVDLAGNSVDLSQPTSSPGQTEVRNIRYLRYEPIGSPITLLGTPLREGEMMDHLVIRSNYNQSVEEFEAGHGMPPESVRFFLPPQNSQQIAEFHGMFDHAMGSNPEAAQKAYQLITSLERHYEKDANNQDKVYRPNELEVVYLPDPMAAGIALFMAPERQYTHATGFEPRMFGFFTSEELNPATTNQPIPEDWYHARHIRIKLKEGDAIQSEWHPGDRMLEVSLPKGHRLMLKVSTFWREADLKSLSAIWQMVRNSATRDLSKIEQLALSGQHWMVSPARELELVHAVMQPVESPEINDLMTEREEDSTSADVHLQFSVHGESTAQVELKARWEDIIDDGISPQPYKQTAQNTLPPMDIGYHDDVVTKGEIPQEPELRKVKNIKTLDATPLKSVKPLNGHRLKVEETNLNSSRFRMQFKEQFNYFALHINDALKQEFGDTKHRWVDYCLTGASRYPKYFEKIMGAAMPPLSPIRDGKWLERVDILSTSRPQAMEIDYIIPTFEWQNSQNENTFRHKRLGGGLRIFIKRPWYTTGADELLGVVIRDKPALQPATIAVVTPTYTSFFTHWGIDPIHISEPPVNLGPAVEDFRNPSIVEHGITYPGEGELRATVVGYPVQFDDERQVWYSDVAINPGKQYFPFVRLALGRFQPHSLRLAGGDICLSPVLLAPMIQLMAEREATLTFDKESKNSKFTIEVEGTIHHDYMKKTGALNYLVINIIDTKLVQPIHGIIDDGKSQEQLKERRLIIPITPKEIQNSRYKIVKEIRLPGDYKEIPFEVVVEEYEGHPDASQYPEEFRSLFVDPQERHRLVYADAFKVNAISK